MSRGTRKVRRHTSSQLIRETSGWMRAWTSLARPPPHRRGRILQGRGQGNSLHPQYYGASPLFIVSQDRHPPHIQKKTLTVSGRFGSLLLIGLPCFLRWRPYWMQPARHAPVVQYSMPTTAITCVTYGAGIHQISANGQFGLQLFLLLARVAAIKQPN
jgi:hypothetical protein